MNISISKDTNYEDTQSAKFHTCFCLFVKKYFYYELWWFESLPCHQWIAYSLFEFPIYILPVLLIVLSTYLYTWTRSRAKKITGGVVCCVRVAIHGRDNSFFLELLAPDFETLEFSLNGFTLTLFIFYLMFKKTYGHKYYVAASIGFEEK